MPRHRDNANPGRLEIFERHQPLLFSIAYSILGIRAEAEELLQEARDRWLQSADSELATARTYLVMDMAMASLDRLHVMRPIKRLGKPCPFGVLKGPPAACSASASARSVSKLALMALDGLTPQERSAFLLRKIFKYHYSAIGRILHSDESECRRTVSKVKK